MADWILLDMASLATNDTVCLSGLLRSDISPKISMPREEEGHAYSLPPEKAVYHQHS